MEPSVSCAMMSAGLAFQTEGFGFAASYWLNEAVDGGQEIDDGVEDAMLSVTADGDVVVPLDAEAFGFWLKAAFGTPTTTGAEAACSHEFQSGCWTLPSMAIEVTMTEVLRQLWTKLVVRNLYAGVQ